MTIMMLNKRVCRLASVLVTSAVLAYSVPALAQDVAESHLKAARAAVAAIRATDTFDNILPQAAAALQAQLIQKNPDMEQIIVSTVAEKALALASRRADLEKEAAIAYAKAFSEQELSAIATFYESEAGKKLLEKGPLVTRDLVRAADIWQNGIARALAQQVGEALAAAAGAKVPDAPADAPADAQPADGGNGG